MEIIIRAKIADYKTDSGIPIIVIATPEDDAIAGNCNEHTAKSLLDILKRDYEYRNPNAPFEYKITWI